jgi:hypothetical protein
MLKSLAVALAVGSFGVAGVDTAKAGCDCSAAVPVAAAAAPVAGAPAVANRSYRTYSYQPGAYQAYPTYRSYSAPATGGYRGAPSWDAGRKIRGY